MSDNAAQASAPADPAARAAAHREPSQWPGAAADDASALARILGARSPDLPRDYNHALCAAVARFAPALGFSMRADPGQRAALTPEAIARASGVRCRHVRLPERWWQQDLGPLLAFLRPAAETSAAAGPAQGSAGPVPCDGTEGMPVALLPSFRGGYRLFDPLTGTHRRVDAAMAARIAPRACSYHPPLPDGELSLRDLMKFGGGQSLRDWVLVLFAGSASAALALALPYALALVFSELVPAGDRAHLQLVGVALLLASLTAFGMDYVSMLGHLRISGRGSLQLTAALWDRVLRMPAEAVRAQGVGGLTASLAAAESLRDALAQNAFNLATRGQQMLAALATLFVVAPAMASAAMLLAAGLAAAVWVTLRLQDRAFTDGRATTGDVFNQPTEFLNAIGKLRSAAAEERAFQRWAANYTEMRRRSVRATGLSIHLQAFCAGYEAFAMACAFWLVARPGGVLNDIGLSGTLVLMSALGVFLATMMPMAQGVAMLKVLQVQGRRLDPLLRATPLADGRADPGRLRGRVELDNVSVRYDPHGPLILRNVSLRAEPGEFIAIVGPSGGGKSTLVRVLLGLLAPESGTVSYDGLDLRSLSRDSVRRQIGSVMQGGRLLPGTLLDNIAGPHDVNLDDAWAAARLAAVDEDIAAMPMQMYTMVLDGASTFSGGQVQRILVARSLVSRPPIVIFDEATSALDGHAQAELVERMAGLECTRIVIAHRFSTVRHADRIYVVQQGAITEAGGVDDLIAAGGYVTEVARRERLSGGTGESEEAGGEAAVSRSGDAARAGGAVPAAGQEGMPA